MTILRIKGSGSNGDPTTLAARELAYSNADYTSVSGAGRLYIGFGSETDGDAAEHVVIGGAYFTDKLDHNPGALTASSAIITNSDNKIDQLLVGDITIDGSRITGVTDPSSAQDVATKAYVDSSLGDVQSNRITGLGSEVVANDDSTVDIVIDSSVVGTFDGTGLTLANALVIAGNLTVNGTTTTINSTVLDVDDLNIVVASGAADSAAANGAGFTIDGADATLSWDHANSRFAFNNPVSSSSFVGALTGNASSATALETTRTIGGVSFDGSANIDLPGVNAEGNQNTTGNATTATTATTAVNVTATANNSTNETTYITFVDGVSGAQGIETDSGLTYNPSTGVLTSTIFSGQASTALYADLAEKYVGDLSITCGTVMQVSTDINSNNEIDIYVNSSYIAGVVSTNPAFLMNNSIDGLPLALVGRVPVKITGTVNKGQAVFAQSGGTASASSTGPLVGIALENKITLTEGLIECMLKI